MSTTEILKKVGTQISFADHATDFVGGATKTAIEVGTPVDVQIDLTSLSANLGRESAKFDFGEKRAGLYSCSAVFEFAATPVTEQTVDVLIAPSPISAAANGNPMSIDGVDANAPSGIGTLAELIAASQFIGSFKCTNDATPAIQSGVVSLGFSPMHRYGILLLVNRSGAAFHSDAVECNIIFEPIIDEAQDAVA